MGVAGRELAEGEPEGLVEEREQPMMYLSSACGTYNNRIMKTG